MNGSGWPPSIGAGVLGAIIGMFLQRLAFAIGGFFAGAYVAFRIFEHFHPQGDHHIWMIVGGVIGAIIAALVMDWAIIFISAMAGAAAILSPFPNLEPQMANVLFLLLACIGIVFQSQYVGGAAAPPPPPRSP